MTSLIMTLSFDAKQRLADIQNYLLERTKWRVLLNTPHFVACGLIRHNALEPPLRLTRKPRAYSNARASIKCRTPLTNFRGWFKVVPEDGDH